MRALETVNLKGSTVSVSIGVITPATDIAIFGAWAYFLTAWSWGRGYPVGSFEEIVRMQFAITAMIEDEPIGFGGINLTANNDNSNEFVQWFSAWVVAPQFQRRGIGRIIHRHCIDRAVDQPGPIRATSESFHMHPFFIKEGWAIIQDKETARNEAGKPMYVYGFSRGE
ncbi:MAG: Acetyltransferase domain [Candidatus Parcubacteria bacterium]|jgi:GNAT superfamily N-acetyltransferase